MPFTLVFEGDVRDINVNPFKVQTPYGFPIAVSASDALTESDDLQRRLDRACDIALGTELSREAVEEIQQLRSVEQ